MNCLSGGCRHCQCVDFYSDAELGQGSTRMAQSAGQTGMHCPFSRACKGECESPVAGLPA